MTRGSARRTVRRDDDEFDEFFRTVIERAVRSAERVLLDRAAAEDAAVEALARASAGCEEMLCENG